MEAVPTALIVSNYPILARAVASHIQSRYRVITTTWARYSSLQHVDADFVVLDTTLLNCEETRAVLSHASPGTRAATCSLHQNDVCVYRMERGGLKMEGRFPSLLAVTA
jgi:hypothetical protein